jgi:flagellar protein FlaJ
MKEMNKEKKILLYSVIVALVMVTVSSVISQDLGIIVNVSVIALFIVIVPFFIYKYVSFLWLKSVEREFPNFIRDLAGLKRTGMSLSDAISMTSKANYGKLTPEVKKFANRLSWGVNFLRALEIFSEKFRKSRLIMEAIGIVDESYKSGGNISVTLDSISRDMMALKDIEAERKSIVRSHVMIMYGIFFMFVAISVAIIYVLIPMMMETSGTSETVSGPLMFNFADPCIAGYLPFPCEYFAVMCESFGVNPGVGCYYYSLFFSVLIIQALFMGLIAGQLGENSVFAGIKHSLIMLAAVFLIFTFLIQANLLPI